MGVLNRPVPPPSNSTPPHDAWLTDNGEQCACHMQPSASTIPPVDETDLALPYRASYIRTRNHAVTLHYHGGLMKCILDASLVALLLTLALVVGCGDDDSPSSAGTTELEGIWTGTEAGTSDSWRWDFTGNSLEVLAEGNEVYSGTFAVNTSSSPKRLTVTITSSSYPGYVGETSLAVYVIDGASLTIAANEPGVTTYPSSITASTARRFYLSR